MLKLLDVVMNYVLWAGVAVFIPTGLLWVILKLYYIPKAEKECADLRGPHTDLKSTYGVFTRN